MTDYVIEQAKLVRYLLNPAHPEGGPKCRLFLRFGFRVEAPNELANALIRHAEAHSASGRISTQTLLTKRIVAGPLEAPNGAQPHAISVWQIHPDGRERLISAYIRET